MGFQQTDLHSLQLLLHYRLKVVRSFLPEHCLLPVRYSAAVMLFWLLLPLLPLLLFFQPLLLQVLLLLLL